MNFPLTALRIFILSQTLPLLFISVQAAGSAENYWFERSSFNPEYGGATSSAVFDGNFQENSATELYWLERSSFNPQYGGATATEVFSLTNTWQNQDRIKTIASNDVISGTRVLIPGIRTNFAVPRQTTSAQQSSTNVIR